MPLYLGRFTYTPETWAAFIERPEDRREVARELLAQLGGTLHGFWYAFGEYDGYWLIEARDNVSAAAVATTVAAGGALGTHETTVLMTVDEMLEALGQARELAYRPAGK